MTLNTTGDVGAVTVHSIADADIGGDVTGDIFLPQRTGGGPSTITRVDIAGDLLGDIDASNGSIIEVLVGGDIGTSGAHRTIVAGDNIFNIEADSIYADIDTGAGDFVQRIRTTVGDFVGSLDAASLTFSAGYSSVIRGLIIKGDLDANLHFTNGIFDPIYIDGSLNGDIDIDTSANLDGQVIINRANGGGTWSGDVFVNASTLSPKGSYTQTGLGSRAVGLVPFQCHLQDCSPPHLTTVTSWSQSTDTVTLRHYGPVTWTGMPVRISVCPIGGDCDPDDTFTTDDWEVINSPGGREVVLRLKSGESLPSDHHVHFRPVRADSNMLRCADLTVGGNIPVGDYDYELIYDP